MSRQYNSNISKKANESLAKRAHIVRIEKTIITAIIIIVISLLILLGSSIHAFADSSSTIKMNKYYTSIRVEEGDSLWSIAEENIAGTEVDINDYISEIKSINNISNNIKTGDYIVVSYFSPELK